MDVKTDEVNPVEGDKKIPAEAQVQQIIEETSIQDSFIDEGQQMRDINNLAVLPESTIKFLLDHNIKQGLDKNRAEYFMKGSRSAKLKNENKHQDILMNLLTTSFAQRSGPDSTRVRRKPSLATMAY